MRKNSLWKEVYVDSNLPTLNGDQVVDVLIIGGGITGLTTAFYLKDSNRNVMLIEKDKIAMGVSSCTTGKLNYLHNLIYKRLENNFGYDKSNRYLQSQIEAIALVKKNVKDYKIDCNLVVNDSFVFTNDEKRIWEFQEEADFFDKSNIKNARVKKVPVKFPCVYGLKVPNTAVFHPVKYLYGLKDVISKHNINIYENTRALKVKKEDDTYLVETTGGLIRASTVVVCTHYPFFVVPGLVPFKSHIDRSYVAAGTIDETRDIDAISVDLDSPSIRYHQDKDDKYVIFGAYTHRTCSHFDPAEQMNKTIEDFKKHFDSNMTHYWMTHDVVTTDYLPFIGHVDSGNLLIATGYNKWGMTNGTIAGKLLSDIILGNDNAYKELFDPKRSINYDKIKNTIIDGLITVKMFSKTKLFKNRSFYPDNVEIKSVDGVSCGIYTDEQGIKHIVKNTCPHMKCSLVFNKVDTTWDCPCHGSRFDIDGNVVQGPSVFDIKIKK